MATSNDNTNSSVDNISTPNESLLTSIMSTFQESQNALLEKMFQKFEASQRDLLSSFSDSENRGPGRASFDFASSTPRPPGEQFHNRPFSEELHVIEEYERSRNQDNRTRPNGGSSHRVGAGTFPQLKLPSFDGSEEIDVFITPFERLAARGEWLEQEKIDRLYQCLKGPAMRYLCTLPQEVCQSYSALKGSLINRFGRREPPTTVRRRLSELKQGRLSNEEFAEEIRRLVTRAYPGVGLDMKDQFAAEAFLKGYRNAKIAYEVLNKNPRSLNEALDLVTFLEHNYKATLGKDDKERARRVSWQDENDVDTFASVNRINQDYSPSYLTMKELDNRLKKIEESLQKISLLETDRAARQRSRSPSVERRNRTCFNCGKEGHFSRECRARSKSPDQRTRSFSNEQHPTVSNTNIQSGQEKFGTATKSIKVSHLDSETPGIIVEIKVNSNTTLAVVDTGADATIISDKLATEAGIQISNTARKVTLLNAKDGSEMSAFGGVTATIQIADKCLDWPVFVAPIRDDVLLGIDILREVDAKIMAKQGDLIVGEKLLIGKRCYQAHSTSVFAESSVIIPSASEKIIVGRVKAPKAGETYVLDPDSFHSGLKIGSVLVQSRTSVPIRILNLDDKDITIGKDTRLGKLTSIESELESTKITVSPERMTSDDMPKHLDTLFQKAKTGLSKTHERLLGNLLKRYQNVFAKSDFDLGCFKSVTHKINTGTNIPVRQPARRTPLAFQSEEDDHLDKMLQSGVVVPSCSEWASPVVLVRKKDGGLRWCVDYRKLNERTTKDAYPLPKIEECLDTLSGSCLFSTLDLMSGYYQVALDEEDRSKSAFIVKRGLYEYTRMPFGLCNAPSTFQRAMELILRGLQWNIVLIYLDDIIVTGRTFEEHIQRLSEVLQRFEDYGLKLKPSKCNLFQKKVLFLGHTVSENGIETNPGLVKDVQNWPIPATKKELQSFLGLTNYYRKFIKGYADVASPLYELQKKDADFAWSERQQESFDRLKECLMSSCVLAYPRETGRFILDTDASDNSIGAVLSQEQDGEEKVISYASKALGPSQRKYCVTRRELLAIVVFTNQFKHYLLGKPFIVRTDHSSLAWLFRFKQPQGQLARWLEELGQYTFVIQHRAGAAHGNADALSRKGFSETECACYEAGKELATLPCKGCSYCTKLHDTWERFETDVDYVLPVAVRRTSSNNKTCHQETEDPECNWLAVHDPQEVAAAQKDDPELGVLFNWVMSESVPSPGTIKSEGPILRHYWLVFDQLLLIDGVLHYRWETKSTPSFKLIVPRAMRREILESCHNPPHAGHQGVERTLERVRQSFYWFQMRKDVQHFVEHCDKCGSEKKSNLTPKAPMQSYFCGAPLDRVQLDVLGPLPESTRGNKYILVIIDQFSKWVEAYPIPHQGSELVAEKLVNEFIARFGVPLELHTDQESNFQSDLFRRVCKLLRIAQTRTTPFHPASNGQVERFNRTLLQMIRCYLEEGQNHWDDQLPMLLAAYRSTPHSATKFTPNRLMLGREVYQPQELIFKQSKTIRMAEEPTDFVERLEKHVYEAESLARKHLKAAQCHQKRMHDINVVSRKYNVGDLVYILNSGRKKGKSPKLQSVHLGPFIVTKVHGPVIYEVKNNKTTKTLHHNKLKPYISENIPTWVTRMLPDIQQEPQFIEASTDPDGEEAYYEESDQTSNTTQIESSLRIPDLESTTNPNNEHTHSEGSQRILTDGVMDVICNKPFEESSLRIQSEGVVPIQTKHSRSGRQIRPRTILDL